MVHDNIGKTKLAICKEKQISIIMIFFNIFNRYQVHARTLNLGLRLLEVCILFKGERSIVMRDVMNFIKPVVQFSLVQIPKKSKWN